MLTSFITQLIGAFIAWIFKGFKGSFKDEIAKPYERSFKYYRNSVISFVIIVLLYWIYSVSNYSS